VGYESDCGEISQTVARLWDMSQTVGYESDCGEISQTVARLWDMSQTEGCESDCGVRLWGNKSHKAHANTCLGLALSEERASWMKPWGLLELLHETTYCMKPWGSLQLLHEALGLIRLIA
jgi:bacterioferritin-associated ferredoxin